MTRLLLILASLSIANILEAQTITWSAPVAVAPAGSGNEHPRISLDKNGDPLILWGNSAMNGQAMFSRWNGTSFSSPVGLNPMATPIFTADWAGSNITSKGDTVYVVFKQMPETDTSKHIYLTRSFDGGQNFSAPMRVDYTVDSLSWLPTVTTDDLGNPVVGFMKFDPGMSHPRYVMTSSADFGNSFLPDVLVSSTSGDVCDCCPATILIKGNTRVMLYRNNLSNIRTMWAGISSNGGNNFSNVEVDNTNWTIMSCPSSGPDAIIAGDTLHTVFMSQGGGSIRVYQSKMVLSTGTLSDVAQITGSITGLSQQNYPRIAASGTAAAIVWRQAVSGTTQLALSFTNSIANGFPSTPEIVASGGITNTDIAMSPGVIHVVWQDFNSNTVMYRKGTYPTGIKDVRQREGEIAFYPNPATKKLMISSSAIDKCLLIDMSGRSRELLLQQDNNSTVANLEDIQGGNYILQLIDNNGSRHNANILVY